MDNLKFQTICKENFKKILANCDNVLSKSGSMYVKIENLPVLDSQGYSHTISKEHLDYKRFFYDHLINFRQFEPFKEILNEMINNSIFLKFYSGILNESGVRIENPSPHDIAAQTENDFLNLLTYTYLKESNSTIFNENTFDSIFNQMMNFASTDYHNAYAFLPIYGLAGDFSMIELSDSVKISELTPKNFSEITDMDTGRSSVPEKKFHKLKYGLYLKLDVTNRESVQSERILSVAQKALDVLRLFKTGNVHFGAIYSYTPDLWPRKNQLPPKTGTENTPDEISNPMEITSSEIPTLKNFYKEYTSILLDNPDSALAYLTSAIRRFNISYENKIIGDRIADLCISLETMLVDSPGEITLRLALLVAILLGHDEEEIEYLWRFIKKCYSVRSEIVHGKKRTKIIIFDKEYTDNETAITLENTTRNAIRKIIIIQKQFRSQQELIEALMVAIVNRNKIVKPDGL